MAAAKKQTRHPSALKRNRQRITRTARNRAVASSVRTYVKKVRALIEAKDVKGAEAALRAAISEVKKASSKGVINKKTASRTEGRLSAAVHKASKKA